MLLHKPSREFPAMLIVRYGGNNSPRHFEHRNDGKPHFAAVIVDLMLLHDLLTYAWLPWLPLPFPRQRSHRVLSLGREASK